MHQAALKMKVNGGAGRGREKYRGVASGCVSRAARRGYHGTEETERWNSQGDSAELAGIIIMPSVIYAES